MTNSMAKRIIAILAALAVLFAMLSVPATKTRSSHHRCSHADCPICTSVQHSARTTDTSDTAPVITGKTSFLSYQNSKTTCIYGIANPNSSLVTKKIRIND